MNLTGIQELYDGFDFVLQNIKLGMRTVSHLCSSEREREMQINGNI